MTPDSSQPEQIQTFGIDQQLKRMGSNIMTMSYVMLMTISHKARDVLKAVQAIFKLKDDKIEPPDMYLGAALSVMEDDGVQDWCMTSDKYVKSAV